MMASKGQLPLNRLHDVSFFRNSLQRVLAALDAYTPEDFCHELSLMAQRARGRTSDDGVADTPIDPPAAEVTVTVNETNRPSEVENLQQALANAQGQLLAYEQAWTHGALTKAVLAGLITMGHEINTDQISIFGAKGSDDTTLKQFSDAVIGAIQAQVVPVTVSPAKARALEVIRRAYDFTVKTNGELMALTSGDMGFESTGLMLDMNGWRLDVSPDPDGLPDLPVAWRWRSAKGVTWTYVDGHPSEAQRAWLIRFGHLFEDLFTRQLVSGQPNAVCLESVPA